MSKWTKLTAFGLIVGIVLSSSSCGLFRKWSDSMSAKGLVESPSLKNYQPEDVPILANFSRLPNESFAYVTGTVRTVYMKYVGSARTDDVVNFYRSQMETNGWNEVQAGKRDAVLFKKGKELCMVEIIQLLSETNLIIRIGYYKSEAPDPYRK
jgi:hypothetical protein